MSTGATRPGIEGATPPAASSPTIARIGRGDDANPDLEATARGILTVARRQHSLVPRLVLWAPLPSHPWTGPVTETPRPPGAGRVVLETPITKRSIGSPTPRELPWIPQSPINLHPVSSGQSSAGGGDAREPSLAPGSSLLETALARTMALTTAWMLVENVVSIASVVVRRRNPILKVLMRRLLVSEPRLLL